jgi:hypothetical protein
VEPDYLPHTHPHMPMRGDLIDMIVR